MAFLKTANFSGSLQILEHDQFKDILHETHPEVDFVKVSNVIDIDPKRYIYARNRSVSAFESHSCNENGDGFPRSELVARHKTFIASRVTIDHDPSKVVGMVGDSVWIPLRRVANNVTGDNVQNLLLTDRKKADKIRPTLEEELLTGKITDTSMGAVVERSICSISSCRNIARNEFEYCDHIKFKKNSKIRVAGSDKDELVFEECYGVTFFEDSLILPASCEGYAAGGRGADPSAKLLQLVASRMLKPEEVEYLIQKLAYGMPEDLKQDFDRFLSILNEIL